MEANIKEEPPEVGVSWEPHTEFCHVKMEPNSWSWHEDASSSRGNNDEEPQLVATDSAARSFIKAEPWDDSEGSVAVEPRNAPKLKLGDKFSTFEDLQMALNTYKDESSCEFFKRDSRTLQGAANRSIDRVNRANTNLIYYDIKYSCTYGRQKGRPRKISPVCQSAPTPFYVDCPAFLYFKLTVDGRYLELLKLNEDHNHLTTRLAPGDQGKMEEFRKRDANKRLLHETQPGVSLSGLGTVPMRPYSVQTKSFLCCISKLKNKYKCSVEVLVTEKGEWEGMFFQTSSMKNTFNRFPEILFLDATYKLLDFKAPLQVLLIEDSCGYSEIIGACILVEQTIGSLNWMVNSFKHLNRSWMKTKVILTDKDPGEREVLKWNFPDAKLLMCFFHTLSSYWREVTRSKGLTPSEEAISREYFSRMAHATSVREYDRLYMLMQQAVPRQVFQYFNSIWHPMREEWVVGFLVQGGNFWNQTTDGSECINTKLRSVVGRYSSIDTFIDQFFMLVNVQMRQRNNVAAKKRQAVPVVLHAKDSPERKYYEYVTEYALKLILSQLSTEIIEHELIFHGDGKYSLKSSRGAIHMTATSCDCSFFKSIALPCSHVFLLRHKLNLDLFEKSLVSERWTRLYVDNSNTLYVHESPTKAMEYFLESVVEPMSDHKKFRNGNIMCSRALALMAGDSTETFHKRYELLDKIFNKIIPHWERNNEVTIRALCEELVTEEEALSKSCAGAVSVGMESVACSMKLEGGSTNLQKRNKMRGNHQLAHNECVTAIEKRTSVTEVGSSVTEVGSRVEGTIWNRPVGIQVPGNECYLNILNATVTSPPIIVDRTESSIVGNLVEGGQILYGIELPATIKKRGYPDDTDVSLPLSKHRVPVHYSLYAMN